MCPGPPNCRRLGGEGNFRFAAAACCEHSGIPYFPAACAATGSHRSFAIGTESSELLASACAAAAGRPHAITTELGALLLQHLAPLDAAARHLEAGAALTHGGSSSGGSGGDGGSGGGGGAAPLGLPGFRYLGIDSSIAPGLDSTPLTTAFAALLERRGGGGRLGGPGSVAAVAGVTAALKALPLALTGYCGLMLPVCEDQGLAEAATAGRLTVSTLLQLSAVCGCGLDTVPVPGPPLLRAAGGAASSEGPPAAVQGSEAVQGLEAAQLEGDMGAVIMDVAALAHRLRKPLACRLLPLPGKQVGDMTDFQNPYLINSAVMPLL